MVEKPIEHSPRLLLADDDVVTREILSAIAGRAGWHCDVATDGTCAYEMVSRNSYDIILTDMEMPGVSGLELTKMVKRQNPAQAIIVITALASTDAVVQCMKAGASDFLSKPVNLRSLEESLRRTLVMVQQYATDSTLFRFVENLSARYSFASRDVAGMRVPLIIGEKLYRTGTIDLSTKLKLDLAFQEAIVNALDHGNLELSSSLRDQFDCSGKDLYSTLREERLKIPSYAERRVSVVTEYDGTVIRILVRDEGQGFDMKPAQTFRPDDCGQLHGRGLLLISATMDDVVYRDGGREVEMTKYVDHAPGVLKSDSETAD